MKRTLSLFLTVALLLITAHRLPAPIQEVPESATPAPKAAAAQPKESQPKPKSKPSGAARFAGTGVSSLPNGAVHLVINSDSDARKIFTYFRFPPALAPPGTTGAYRLEVNPDGTVAAVTILKSMGKDMDTASMKAFVRWRAAPGPLRIVDVGRKIVEIHRVVSH